MKTIRYWLIQLLGVSKTEASGIVLLLGLLIALILTPPFIKWGYSNNYSSFKSDKHLLDSILGTIQIAEPAKTESESIVPQLTNFDPNKVTIAEMIQLGFTAKQAQNISNYRNKNGVFKIKKDLLRIYSIDSIQYSVFQPYLLLPEKHAIKFTSKKHTKSTYKKTYTNPPKPVILAFDINLADTTTLKQIRGIGSVLSSRIIKYRERLGGFVDINQLNEVYGLDDEPLNSLKSLGFIDANLAIRRININTANFDTLYQHMYINKKIANSIITYRNQHGHYQSLGDIKKIHLIDDKLFDKLYPYLTIE